MPHAQRLGAAQHTRRRALEHHGYRGLGVVRVDARVLVRTFQDSEFRAWGTRAILTSFVSNQGTDEGLLSAAISQGPLEQDYVGCLPAVRSRTGGRALHCELEAVLWVVVDIHIPRKTSELIVLPENTAAWN